MWLEKFLLGELQLMVQLQDTLVLPNSSRMVGWAMNASHQKSDIPAHRVVNRIGLLSGKHHFYGSDLMKQLLENEGINIENDKVINFDKVFWDPKDMDN